MFDTGHQVGDLAKGLFGEYRDVTVWNEAGYPDIRKMVSRTTDAIEEGVENICEAAFLYGNNYCAVDLLHRTENGWAIYEVKSSTEQKAINLYDVAYQKYVLEACQLNVTSVNLVVLNNQYVRAGELDIQQLFKTIDVTTDCDELMDEVRELVEGANKVLQSSDEPQMQVGLHCCSPYDCAFWQYCSKPLNMPEPSVMDMYRMGKKKIFDYISQGKLSYADLKGEKLSEKQQRQIRCYEDGTEEIDRKGIKSFLETVEFPLYHLDFETMQLAVPEFDGTRPYQQVPFQYSLHIQQTPCGALEHREFLAESGVNPLRAIAESLCENIPDDVCVMSYNKSFECTRLEELACMFDDLATHLRAIKDNMVDLLRPFQDGYYYTPAMKGSFSIKSVLPALFPDDPELDYHNLQGSVHNGTEAMNIFPRIKDMPKREQLAARKSLLRYCELDTYAMVKVLNHLYEICGMNAETPTTKKVRVNNTEEMPEEERKIRDKYRQWRILKMKVSKDTLEDVVNGFYRALSQEVTPRNYVDLVQLDEDGYEREDENCNVIPRWYDYLLLETIRCKNQKYALVEVKDITSEMLLDDNGKIVMYEYKGDTWVMEEVIYQLGDVVEKN